MRLAFVVQRYGEEVAGGAEALCRDTARALAERGHDVRVLTTTSRDYVPWTPYFSPGVSDDHGVQVERFDFTPSDPVAAARCANRIALGWGDWESEAQWVQAQGPVSRSLLARLAQVAPRVEGVALWTYLYATTQLAMPLVAGRGVLVPAAHNEPMFRFAVTRGVVALAGGFAYLTPEERTLVRHTHDTDDRPEQIVGTGVSPRPLGDGARARRRFDLPRRFVVYVGRIDPGKGITELFEDHRRYRDGGGDVELVLVGRRPEGVSVPAWVHALGFVTDQERSDVLAAAEALVMPSVNESLSLVLLEAWQQGRPTLATARNAVLVGQSERSGGGLLYADGRDYTRQLRALTTNSEAAAALGAAGARWVGELTWDRAVARWEALFTAVGERSSETGSAGR